MATVPAPITLPPRLPPDRDFDALRAAAIDVVVEDAGPTWTDHNFSDPGITLLEVIAWGLADLHYRTANRGFELAPLELPLWLGRDERDWYGLPDLGNPSRVVGLAALIAAHRDAMAAAIVNADSRRTAIGALVGRAFGGAPQGLAWDEAAAVVALLRAPQMRRAALDHSATVATAWQEARRTVERRAHGGPVSEADVDTETIRLFGFEPGLAGLWDEELLTLIRRYRHRIFLERVAGFLPALTAASTSLELDAVKSDAGITNVDWPAVLALHACPPGEFPETWEEEDGTTTTWPPHPLQALTTEPVTAEDYATRARSAEGVRRAWTAPGALAGIAWDGSERATAEPERTGAVTVLVELAETPQSVAAGRTAMRSVLESLVGPVGAAELKLPYDTLMEPHLDGPRRVMCDELGVALVRECPVTLSGVLHVALGADRLTVLKAATARVRAWFAAGRTESSPAAEGAAACPQGIEGPWPPIPQPAGGWTPGEAIRLHELVQVLADDPTIIGVEGVEALVNGVLYGIATGATEAPLDPDCVPILPDEQCLQVRLELGADCRG